MVGKLEEMTITVELVDDGGEGVYRWLLDVAAPTLPKVVTLSEVMALLGEPDLRRAGTEATESAVAILQKAVQAAKHAVHRLSDHVEAGIDRGGN